MFGKRKDQDYSDGMSDGLLIAVVIVAAAELAKIVSGWKRP